MAATNDWIYSDRHVDNDIVHNCLRNYEDDFAGVAVSVHADAYGNALVHDDNAQAVTGVRAKRGTRGP
jgi:hypothetical protein